MKKEKAFEFAVKSTRDNSRTPVQWDDSKNAGFTTGTPWFPVNENYKQINAKAEMANPDSIYNHYKKLIKFKKTIKQNGEIIRNITKIPISFMFIHVHSTAKDFWLLIRFPMSVCRLKRQRALTLKREHLFFAIMKIILFSATVLSSDLMKQEFICLNNLNKIVRYTSQTILLGVI